MSSGTASWLALGGVGGWLIAKIGDRLFDAFASNLGKVEFIPMWCAFTCNLEHPERGIVRARYNPSTTSSEELSHCVLIEGEFANHRESTILMSKPVLWLMHARREPFIFSSPEMTVDGTLGVVISIPPSSSVKVQLKLSVPRAMLSDYEGVLPVLELSQGSKRSVKFRLSSGSFHGPEFAVWPRRGNSPVVVSSGSDKGPAEAVEPAAAETRATH